MNFYEILGVPKTATQDEIKSAYREKAKTLHPDRTASDPEATKKFKEVQEAYETLSDPDKKTFYDRGGNPNPSMRFKNRPPPSSFEDAVNELFGGSIFRGRNVQVRTEIELNEVLTGVIKQIKINKRKKCVHCDSGISSFTTCPECNGLGGKVLNDSMYNFKINCNVCMGSGKTQIIRCPDCAGTGFTPLQDKILNVQIPPGIGNGMSVRVIGEGEEPLKPGKTGDLLVVVLVKDHPIFKVDGIDLTVDVPVSFTQLVLGSKIPIPLLSKERTEIEIPAGSQSNTKFRLKGKGLSNPKGEMGDLIVSVKVETPKVLDEEYKKVLDSLAEIEKKNITPQRENWKKKLEN